MRTFEDIHNDYNSILEKKKDLRIEEERLEGVISDKAKNGYEAREEIERISEINIEYQDLCEQYVKVADELHEATVGIMESNE